MYLNVSEKKSLTQIIDFWNLVSFLNWSLSVLLFGTSRECSPIKTQVKKIKVF